MNTFWLKIAGAGVVVLILLVIAGQFFSDKDKKSPAPETATADKKPAHDIYEQFKRDDKQMDAPVTLQQPAKQTPAKPRAKLRELSTDQDAAAQKMYEWIKTERKMSRLPMFTYTKMVRFCREMIKTYPGTKYEIMARRVLAEVPEHKWKQYNITQKEVDTGDFQ